MHIITNDRRLIPSSNKNDHQKIAEKI